MSPHPISSPKRVVPKKRGKMRTIPDKALAWEHKQSKQIKRALIQEHGAVCAICGKHMANMKDVTLDHIIPISKGGLTIKENCQLACYDCNQRKGNIIEP